MIQLQLVFLRPNCHYPFSAGTHFTLTFEETHSSLVPIFSSAPPRIHRSRSVPYLYTYFTGYSTPLLYHTTITYFQLPKIIILNWNSLVLQTQKYQKLARHPNITCKNLPDTFLPAPDYVESLPKISHCQIIFFGTGSLWLSFLVLVAG